MNRLCGTFLMILSIVALPSNCALAQNKLMFGVGIATSYMASANDAAITLNFDIKKVFNVHFLGSSEKFSGYGIGGGMEYYLFQEKIWQPMIGFAYNYQNGVKSILIGNDPVTGSEYRTHPSNRCSSYIGVRFVLKSDNLDKKSFITISPFLSYRFVSTNNEVEFISGIHNDDNEQRINKKLNTGVGGGLSAVFYFW